MSRFIGLVFVAVLTAAITLGCSRSIPVVPVKIDRQDNENKDSQENNASETEASGKIIQELEKKGIDIDHLTDDQLEEVMSKLAITQLKILSDEARISKLKEQLAQSETSENITYIKGATTLVTFLGGINSTFFQTIKRHRQHLAQNAALAERATIIASAENAIRAHINELIEKMTKISKSSSYQAKRVLAKSYTLALERFHFYDLAIKTDTKVIGELERAIHKDFGLSSRTIGEIPEVAKAKEVENFVAKKLKSRSRSFLIGIGALAVSYFIYDSMSDKISTETLNYNGTENKVINIEDVSVFIDFENKGIFINNALADSLRQKIMNAEYTIARTKLSLEAVLKRINDAHPHFELSEEALIKYIKANNI